MLMPEEVSAVSATFSDVSNHSATPHDWVSAVRKQFHSAIILLTVDAGILL